MTKLLPCPFCGATPHRGLTKVINDQLHGEPIQGFRIWCPHSCSAIQRTSEELAISAWNSRSAIPASAQGAMQPVAWMVVRDADRTFPRFYRTQSGADAMVESVTAYPSAEVRPLYTTESQAKEPEASGGLCAEASHAVRVGEASADLPTTSEFMDVTAGETAPNFLADLAEQLREYTAMKYAGDCKCGKCQLVPRALVERIYHVLNGTALTEGMPSSRPATKHEYVKRIGECEPVGALLCRRFYPGTSACTAYDGLARCIRSNVADPSQHPSTTLCRPSSGDGGAQ